MILVTGCGPLAAGIIKAFPKDAVVKSICDRDAPDIETGQLTYDIMSSADVSKAVKGADPEIIILAEEVCNLEYCEQNRMDAMFYNTRLIRYIVEAAGNKARMVYVSSANVFDGRKPGGMYTPQDKVNPLNVYAETKVMGEVNVDKSPGYLIVRLGEVYGEHVDNFATHIIAAVQYGEKVFLATDMYFSPIYVEDAAKAIAFLAKNGMSGIYHVAGPDRISHYDFGLAIADIFGLDKSLIVPVTADSIEMTVLMPRDISLDTSKFSVLMKVRDVKEGLKTVKQKM